MALFIIHNHTKYWTFKIFCFLGIQVPLKNYFALMKEPDNCSTAFSTEFHRTMLKLNKWRWHSLLLRNDKIRNTYLRFPLLFIPPVFKRFKCSILNHFLIEIPFQYLLQFGDYPFYHTTAKTLNNCQHMSFTKHLMTVEDYPHEEAWMENYKTSKYHANILIIHKSVLHRQRISMKHNRLKLFHIYYRVNG